MSAPTWKMNDGTDSTNNDRSKYHDSFIGPSAVSFISPLHLVGTVLSFWPDPLPLSSPVLEVRLYTVEPDSTPNTLKHSGFCPKILDSQFQLNSTAIINRGPQGNPSTTPLRQRPKTLANGEVEVTLTRRRVGKACRAI